MSKNKSTKKNSSIVEKQTVKSANSTENMKPIWMFDKIDHDGQFAFDIRRPDFQHSLFLDKMISYSNMTWSQIRYQTHDDGKSKHHFLEYNSLSKAAQDRIKVLRMKEDTDRIYSFALQNKLRVIGVRGDNSDFHIIWYDANHEICPSKKKHT